MTPGETVHRFRDRQEAGVALAQALERLPLPSDRLVLGLPRGGVPIACEVARRLNAPLDVMVVRKIGMPWQPELAVGAVASSGVVVRDPQLSRYLGRRGIEFERLAERERAEVERREQLYRSGRLSLRHEAVILVDDGVATGSTMLAAVRAARTAGAGRIVVAAPVASTQALQALRAEADDVVVLQVPAEFHSVGQCYASFEQVADEQVRELLSRCH
jgi:putative phosphoribosyl transferase